jgi:hypothetical protein
MNTHAQVIMDMLTTTLKKANIFTKQHGNSHIAKRHVTF